MSTPGISTRNSCNRCHDRKVRCSKTTPRCDKCEAANVECVYSPRKPRTRKPSNVTETDLRDVLIDVYHRLKRLEDYCDIDTNDGDPRHPWDPASDPADDALSHTESQPSASRILGMIMDPATRAQLSSNVFCHLRNAESRFFENEKCIEAIGAVVKDVEHLFSTKVDESQASPPIIPKELARKWIQMYYDSYRFEAFRIPFGKDFLMSIPDLLEIPHVQLDYTSRIIYYNVLLHGIMTDSEYDSPKEGIVYYLFRVCMILAEGWLRQIKNTPADLMVSFTLLAVALEACNIELSWKILGHSCAIARALGYFCVDDDPEESNGQNTQIEDPTENEIDKNRKRFEFWYLLRTDGLFRLSFGKPALIPDGSWRVDLPDPTINGVDDASTRFIQIHFLASMRLTLVLLKYLNLVDTVPKPALEVYDKTVGHLIAEVQAIMQDWDAEELLKTTTNLTDSSFCIDILFQSYTMLVVLDQDRNWDDNSDYLPRHTVSTARKSLEMFKLMIGLTGLEYWGVSMILLHQFAPLFILCLDIVEFPEREDTEADLELVVWVSEFVEKAAEARVNLRPAMAVMRMLALVCQRVKSGDHSSSSTT